MSNLKVNPGAQTRIALASYLAALDRRPILTKSCTSGSLYLISELVSSAVAAKSLPPSARAKLNPEGAVGSGKGEVSVRQLWSQFGPAVKLAAYGFFVAAPLDHHLYELLGRVFAGRTSEKARVLEVVASNTVILPIQNAVYLAVLSVIGGARSAKQVFAEVKTGFLEVMRFTVVVATLALVFAQRFLPASSWTVFFSIVGASMDTVINVQEKRRAALEAVRRDLKNEAKESKEE
ncbi:hypothetical protein JCM8097_005011 [Rhodosporidiobolus ruineniae]